MRDLVTAFGLIALAELGDKSQILALALSSRYRWWQVLAGVASAAVVVLGLATLLGGVLGAALPERVLAIGGGVVFLGFAAYTAWDRDDEDGAEGPVRSAGPVIVAIAAAFVVAELGDKTMLGAAALAAQGSPALVWAGAAAGMTAASGVAIGVGRLLGTRLPAHVLRWIASGAFALFGVLLLVEGLRG